MINQNEEKQFIEKKLLLPFSTIPWHYYDFSLAEELFTSINSCIASWNINYE